METWWPALPQETRDWLADNNGSAVPHSILVQIEQAGGPARGSSWWIPEEGTAGVSMPDAAIDWIEAAANGEAARES